MHKKNNLIRNQTIYRDCLLAREQCTHRDRRLTAGMCRLLVVGLCHSSGSANTLGGSTHPPRYTSLLGTLSCHRSSTRRLVPVARGSGAEGSGGDNNILGNSVIALAQGISAVANQNNTNS